MLARRVLPRVPILWDYSIYLSLSLVSLFGLGRETYTER